MRVIHEPAVALSTRRSDVPSFLDAAVRRALAKQPDDRFPSAAAFAAALAVPLRGETSPTHARRSAWCPRARRCTPPPQRWSHRPRGRLGARPLVAPGALDRRRVRRSERGVDRRPPRGVPRRQRDMSLTVVDRAGRTQRTIAASRPWTPRFSPDGRQVAYGAFGSGRSTSDLWVTDLDAGTTRRLTDDENDSNDPQWSADGATVAYSASAPEWEGPADAEGWRRQAERARGARGDTVRERLAARRQRAARHRGNPHNRRDILVQPVDGSTAWPYAATAADETAARVSPDGRWVAYTSDESGRAEVYLDSYPRPRRRVSSLVERRRASRLARDGRELYYWSDGALVAVQLGAAGGRRPPAVMGRTVLFRASYHIGPNTMYDVSPDGERFVIVHSPWTNP